MALGLRPDLPPQWHTPRPSPSGNQLERHAGWILAACLHVAAFSGMMMVHRPGVREPEPKKQPILVRLAEPEPTPTPYPTPQPTPEPTPPPTVRRQQSIMPSPLEQAGGAASEDESSPASRQQASSSVQQTRQPKDPAKVEATMDALRKRASQMSNLNKYDAFHGSEDIAQRLRLARADIAADKTLFAEEPRLQRGVDRELNINDVEFETAKRVLARYGIELMLYDLSKASDRAQINQGGKGLINRAVTQKGVFTRPESLNTGVYQAFTFNSVAESHMARLEEEAILERGWNPEKVRVTRVVFGVVPTLDGYDLGVKIIKAEAIQVSER